MALVSSGWISMAEISGEFGSYGNPRWLSWYYRGAGLVPNTSRNSKIPTSGTIWLSQFYGSSAATSGSYNPRTLGWTSFTWPAYENMDVYVYGAGGGGGGAAYTHTYTVDQKVIMITVKRSVSQVVAGSNGNKGGDSVFQCNGFNITAIGGDGGTGGGGYGNSELNGLTGQYYMTNGNTGNYGYGVNGNTNQTGGGGNGGGGTYWSGNWYYGYGGGSGNNDPRGWTQSTGGAGGSGGYAKRSISKGGYGSYNNGTITSLHIGSGGSGGFTGGAWFTNLGQAGWGNQGWIDIYWS